MQKKFSGKSNSVAWAIDLDKIPADKRQYIIDGAIEQGLTIILQRAKSGEDLKVRMKAVSDIAARIQDGSYTFGGGGIRAVSYPERAELEILREYFRAEDSMTKTKAEAHVKPKTLEAVWQQITRRAVIAQLQANGASSDDISKTDIDALVTAENIQAVRDANFQADITARAKLLEEIDQKKAAGTKKVLTVGGLKL